MKNLFPTAAFLVGCLVISGGCSGIFSDADSADGGANGVTLRITEPAANASYVADTLGETGRLVAAVAVGVESTGDVARILVETASGTPLGELTESGIVPAEVSELGMVEIVVRAIDAGGQLLGEARVAIVVGAPTVADCHGWLDLYGLDYSLAGDTPGVDDPLTVMMPLNGMAYRYLSNDTPRETLFMDCSLALSLAKASPILRERGVIEVLDIGVYNYRCIGGGTPPDCPNGVSQHAYATAIDIAGVVDANDVFYSVNDDWLIDPSSEETCAAATEGDKDTFLHQLICALKGERVWNIVLTPNYNAAHRNHFHVDLTPGADFIRSGQLVDVGPDNH